MKIAKYKLAVSVTAVSLYLSSGYTLAATEADMIAGHNNQVYGSGNVVQGNNNRITRPENVVKGNDNGIHSPGNMVQGNGNVIMINARRNKVIGNNNRLEPTANNNLIIRDNVTLRKPETPFQGDADNNVILGSGGSLSAGSGNVIIGYHARPDEKMSARRSDRVIVGRDAQATSGGTVVGSEAQATGHLSLALGNHAKATGDRSVSLGWGSLATESHEMNIGHRFISGLQDGYADSHAVTVRQLQAAIRQEQKERAGALNTEKEAREQGDTNTLISANLYTGNKVTESDSRTDDLISQEQKARTEALNAEKVTREQGDANTLISANLYTDNKVTESNSRTDDLISKEQKARTEALNAEKVAREQEDVNALKNANKYADHRIRSLGSNVSDALNDLQQKTDQKLAHLNNKIDRMEKRANAGIAGVTAISSIPYVNSERFSFGMAMGHYRDAQAIAAGGQYKPTANTNVRVNASWNNGGDTNIGAGVAVGW